jgi:hypothetical protein
LSERRVSQRSEAAARQVSVAHEGQVGTPLDRRHCMRVLVAVALSSLAACQGFVGGGHGDDDYVATLPDGPCSTGAVTGTLPGVTISIVAPSCVFHRGEAATFEYEVVVDGNAPAIDVPETGIPAIPRALHSPRASTR